MKISEEDWKVVRHRVEVMPSHINLAIGGDKPLSRNEILVHIDKRDNIGKRVVMMQMNYLRFFKKEMTAIVND